VIAMLEGLALVWFAASDRGKLSDLGDAPMEALLNGFRARPT
jgi:hypothetical protein